MRARVLGDRPVLRQHAVGGQALQRGGPLPGQCRGLEAQRLLRDVVGADQLREPAPRAEPHPQRQQRVGSRVVGGGEQLAGRLLPQVQHHVPGRAAAEPAGDGRVGGDGDGVGQRRGGHAVTVAPRLPRPCTSRPTDARCTACARAALRVHGRFERTRAPGARGRERHGHYGGRVQVVQTELDGVLLFEPTPHRDARASSAAPRTTPCSRGGDRSDVPAGLPVAQRPRRDPWDARAVGAG